MNIPCFVIVRNGRQFVYLRRFTFGEGCPLNNGFGHDAMIQIEDSDVVYSEDGKYSRSIDVDKFGRKGEFPETCACGYEFKEEDKWQVHTKPQYIREDKANEEKYHLWQPPVGAMWDAYWLHDMPSYCGADGKALHVMTPCGEWNIDSRASNCTRPEDSVHKCWVRHGVPPNITVDKNGDTCSAGAGSIQIKEYHGFLRNGELTDC